MTTEKLKARTTRLPSPGRIVFSFFFLIFLAGGVYWGNVFVENLPLLLADANPVSAVVAPVAAAVLPGSASSQAPAIAPDWGSKERVNILLLGTDQRPDEKGDPGRTDTMIVLTIDPFSHTAGLLSLPRDLWVSIPVAPDRAINERINAAYFIGEYQKIPGGGSELARRTVEQLLGIRINYYVLISFDGFEQIIDTLGGIDIEVEKPIRDTAYPLPDYSTTTVYFPAGPQHMDGKTALIYARTRHADNDFNRTRRQQQVILAARKKALQLDLLPKLPLLYAQLNSAVRTNLSLNDLVALANLGREIDLKAIDSRTLDGPYLQEVPGQYVYLPNKPLIRQLVAEMFADTPLLAENARVEVLNGGRQTGLASRVAGVLREKSFPLVTFGNAEAPVSQTEIFDLTGKPYTVKRLAELFPGARVTVAPDPAATTDVRIVLGDDARVPE